MPSANALKEQAGGWESFVALWERANLIRSYFWSHQSADERTLLAHFLARLRRFFGVDFCFGFVMINADNFAEVGLPEASVHRLPSNFSQRCLNLVGNSRAPITWNEVSGGFGFRNTVLAPLTSPTGRAFGFLMLAHSSRKSYSPAELFLLQALATELSWFVRDLAARRDRQQQLSATCHNIKNALQVIIGNTTLMRRTPSGAAYGDQEKCAGNIESSAQQILDCIDLLSAGPIAAEEEFSSAIEGGVDIAAAVGQSVAAHRRLAEARGVKVEMVYAPQYPGDAILDRPVFTQMLDALVGSAVSAIRDETIRLIVRREAARLELTIRGLKSNQVAEELKSLFESAARTADENGDPMLRTRQYLDEAGGDVYLKSRPGETAEFIVCLPLESSAQTGRPKLKNQLSS